MSVPLKSVFASLLINAEAWKPSTVSALLAVTAPQDTVPEPFVISTWLALPSVDGKVNALLNVEVPFAFNLNLNVVLVPLLE